MNGIGYGSYLEWYEKDADRHRSLLDRIDETKFRIFDAVTLKQVRHEFEPVREFLVSLELEGVPRPMDATMDEAFAFLRELEKKEAALKSVIELTVQEYKALPLDPRLTIKGFQRGQERFEWAKGLISSYYDASRSDLNQRLDGIEKEVKRKALERLLQRSEPVVENDVCGTPWLDAYDAVKERFTAARAQLEKQAYLPERFGAKRRLDQLVDDLQGIREDAAASKYDFLPAVDQTCREARRRAERADTIKAGRTAKTCFAAMGIIGTLAVLIGIHEAIARYRASDIDIDVLNSSLVAVAAAEKEAKLPSSIALAAPSPVKPRLAKVRCPLVETGPTSRWSEQRYVYVVQRGDSLSKIRQRFYQDSEWRQIYQENRGLVNHPQNWIFPGQPLLMPKYGLRNHAGLIPIILTSENAAHVESQGWLNVPLYQAVKTTTYTEISRELTGTIAYADQIKDAFGGANRVLGKRIQANDYVHLPPSLPIKDRRHVLGGV